MDQALHLVAMLGGQLFAGAAALALASGRATVRRRRTVVLRRAAARAAPWGLGGLAASAAALVPDAIDGGLRGWFAVAVLFGAPGATGALLMLAAGRDERRGRVRPARRLAFAAGQGSVAGSVACASLAGAVALGLPPAAWPASGRGIAGAAALALLLSGGAGLLGGLSRKPRPAGGLAVALWILGAALLATLAGR